jgi:hypothetical protein
MRKLIVSAVLILVACGDEPPPAIRVGRVSFHEGQLLGLSETRRTTLANLTAFALAVADSAAGELGAPLVRRWEGDRLLDILAAELTLEKNGVADAVLEARYLTDPEYELTVRHVLFFSERWRTSVERDAAKEKAERALQLLHEGADFPATAAQMSEEPGAEGRQGLLAPGREGAWVDEFWAAASALDVGQMSGVTETQYGFHILLLEGRQIVPFGEARTRVAREVADRIEDPRAVLEAWVDERKGSLHVRETNESDVEDGQAGAPVLPTWDGGRLTEQDVRAWVATEFETDSGSVAAASPDALAALAGRTMALSEAKRRRLSVPEAERAELARMWDDYVYRWSTSLGFRVGLPTSGVHAAALAALAETGQGAAIARQDLDERAPLLRARYPFDVFPAG